MRNETITADGANPLYEKVKGHILHKIDSGAWKAAQKIPSENTLIVELGVSKMTVNRALRELADAGYINRVVGVGSFVAESKIHVHPLEVRNIAEDIRSRGHTHTCEVVLLAQERANARLAANLGIAAGAPVYHSIIVHFDNSVAIQLEDRYVNPKVAPDYLEVDFRDLTPNEYLTKTAPLQEVEHVVEAILPPTPVADLLNMSADQPCLLISRRTWTGEDVASGARLYHPGNLYRLGERFNAEPSIDPILATKE